MTVEQYLHTSFEVEPDYVDGELVERHVGSLPHAKAKGRMLELLGGLKGFSWRLYMSITMIMSPTRCRVADLAAFANEPLPESSTRMNRVNLWLKSLNRRIALLS